MAATPDGKGYWLVASDGGIFAYGDAGFYGSTGGLHPQPADRGHGRHPRRQGLLAGRLRRRDLRLRRRRLLRLDRRATLNKPIVGMAATPDGRGYWLVASDGGIFAYGDAGFYGSAGNLTLNQPIVGMAATPDGRGYWMVASDGGIFAYGDAGFYGSTGLPSTSPWWAWPPRPTASGYWLVAADGGIFAYGDVAFGGGRRPPAAGSTQEQPSTGTRWAWRQASILSSLAHAAGASTLVRTYGGLAPCDLLADMESDVTAWQPTTAILEFSGGNFTPCMAGDPIGSPQYYAKYQADIQTAIDILRPNGTEVFLIGLPYDRVSHAEPERRRSESALPRRWRRPTPASPTSMPARRSWQTEPSPGPFPVFPPNPAPGPRARTWSARRRGALLSGRGHDH